MNLYGLMVIPQPMSLFRKCIEALSDFLTQQSSYVPKCKNWTVVDWIFHSPISVQESMSPLLWDGHVWISLLFIWAKQN